MIPQKSGSIVSMSSVHGVAGFPGFCNYSAAKAGAGFTRAGGTRKVGPHNVRINAITSGYVMTPLSEQLMTPTFSA